ncbi:hypothetical protein G9C98_001507 [Cotesia typhae]|uniref:Uncharacterized protein n=1 Tax=Cotesia typhae TaxID=2053667 RepID=A0A8J5R7J6_9HYME|nr:hypothetical protein G9C98_001507 [Cotesia typhae]
METYNLIKKKIEETHGEAFIKFFSYFESYWLLKMKPESFSVYGMLSDRTNNHQESFHRDMNKLAAAHSHTNVFINGLKKIFEKSRRIKAQIEIGTYCTREAKEKTEQSNREIHSFWKELDARMITGITLQEILDKLENFDVIKNLKNYVLNMTDYLDDSTDEDINSERDSDSDTSEKDSSEGKENIGILHI